MKYSPHASPPATVPPDPTSRAPRHPPTPHQRLLLRPRLRLPPPQLDGSSPPVHSRQPASALGLHRRLERRRTPLRLLSPALLDPRRHPRPALNLAMDPDPL